MKDLTFTELRDCGDFSVVNKTVFLKKNEDHRIRSGHLWAFSNEIAKVEGEPASGDIVGLKNHAGQFLGIGFYNPHSLIAVRLLSRQEEEINSEFFRKRILSALELRKKIYPDETTYRLVNGEADFLPGLIIDKYNDYVTVQTFSAGMDQRLQTICDVLDAIIQPRGIVERNEAIVRTYEGLPQQSGVIRGVVEPTIISEYGIRYSVDLIEGQKTAFFLDQRENRRTFQKYARGATVLDCFCNDGGFALHAAKAGALEVTGVDVSSTAIERAKANAALNEIDLKVQFVISEAFEYLEAMKEQKKTFDVINLDPPSFTKSKKMVRRAKHAYAKLHRAAFELLTPGGILATASCAHHIFDDVFLEIISSSAQELGRTISLLEWHGASPDHPVLPAMPETKYLKFGVFKVE
ncbi:MAG: class I SAM-dependent rRNA methyltransferase [Bacteroidetes bacterium]|nr:MAG: class I SAM-dependent rRNA methyltransferase [Bacteroidota bacterium]